MFDNMNFVMVGLLGYIIGSIPWGLIVVKLAGLGDVRKIGSGSTGATNVLRTGSKWLALITLTLDAVKGFLSIALALFLLPESISMQGVLLVGLLTILGHNYPIWLKFKGGKGIAAAFGVLLAVSWQVAILCGLVWLLTAIVFRYSSLASLVATASAPIFTLFFMSEKEVPMIVILAIMIFISHRANIKRLIKREESKIKLSSK